MPTTSIAKVVLAAGFTLGASLTIQAADAPKLQMGASDSMLANTCIACHGLDGGSKGPATPTITGLSKDYFIETMEGFANGNIKSTIMGRIAKGYTGDEIKQLANFYTTKKFVKVSQAFNADLVDKGAKLHDKYCEKCHAEGGQSAEDDAGVMAGQWTPYLVYQMQDFEAGTREAPKKMNKKVKELMAKEGQAGIDALLSYYASQQK